MLVSSGYPFCSEELCIRFLCQELSAPKNALGSAPFREFLSQREALYSCPLGHQQTKDLLVKLKIALNTLLRVW